MTHGRYITPPVRLKRMQDVCGVQVWLVDGKKLRDSIEIDFTMGGNAGRYQWVPLNEVWIDSDLCHADMQATILHEIVERYLMLEHEMSYNDAHDRASAAEIRFRRVGRGRVERETRRALDRERERMAA